ncbi:MAG: hypothetical protein Q9163_000267 [Psora crenata]
METTTPESSVDYKAAKIVCVVGGPGVGKGTQCTRLAADLGLVHISVGDLLREDDASRKPSLNDQDVQILNIMRNASLVPFHYVRKVLDLCLTKHMQNGRSNFLIDGFPRSEEQAHFFDGGEKGWEAKAVLHFHCSEDVMLSRMLKRAQTSGRVDDTADVFRRRYAGHMQEISSVIGAFAGKVVDIDCERPLDDIYEELKCKVQGIFEIVEEPEN